MQNRSFYFIFPFAIFLISTPVAALSEESSEESPVYLWQKNRLLNPTERVVSTETEKQQVYIYEGMKLSDIDVAMEKQFDRAEHMMFINTLPPPGAGEEMLDDGCDY